MELQKITGNEEEDVLTTLARESTSSSKIIVQKAKKKFINYGGIFVGALIVVIMAFVMTTDIKINSFLDFAKIGLSWFILYFCGYAMYVSMGDSGMRAGKRSQEYIDAVEQFDRLFKHVKENKCMRHAQEFCDDYVSKELKATRESILSEIGINYEDYTEHYMQMSNDDIKSQKLSKRVQDTLIRVNAIKPIELTPPMFTKVGRASTARSPIGTDPQKKKAIKYGARLIRSAIVSLLLTSIVPDVMFSFSWAMLAYVCIRILFVIFTGFMGYSYNYENITTDTVNYINDKSTLLQQLIHYSEDKTNESIRSNHESESVENQHIG